MKLDFLCLGEDQDKISEFLRRRLSPGHLLSEIGYSPSLLSRKTAEKVEKLCLSASGIDPATLDVTEETKLKTGMAMTVQKLLTQRHARDKLFEKDVIGLRNDLALRRELRKPLDKVCKS